MSHRRSGPGASTGCANSPACGNACSACCRSSRQFFARHGIEARFTGHPVLQSGADTGDAARFRARHGIAATAPVVMLMPGSRRSEAPRLLPVFGRTLRLLARDLPDLVPVVAASPVVAETVRNAARRWPMRPIIVTEIADKHDAFAASGAALTKSGTSTLELALAGVPMAVTYRVNPLTAAIARRLIRVPHVAMVNLLAGSQLVPELLQQECRPDRLAATLRRLLGDDAASSAQRQGFAAVLASLQAPRGTPAEAAAREILDLLAHGDRLMSVVLSSVLPIFALILAGYVCGRRGTLGPGATDSINRFVVYLALPALLFLGAARKSPGRPPDRRPSCMRSAPRCWPASCSRSRSSAWPGTASPTAPSPAWAAATPTPASWAFRSASPCSAPRAWPRR